MDCDPVRKDPFYLIENTRIIFQKIISKNNRNNSDFYSGYFPGKDSADLFLISMRLIAVSDPEYLVFL